MLFDNDFDVEIKNEINALKQREQNPCIYTETDLQRILAEQNEISYNKGYKDGFTAGGEDANNTTLKKSFDSLENLKPILEELRESIVLYRKESVLESLEVVENLIDSVVPVIIGATYKEKISEIIVHNINNLIDNKWIEFRFSKDVYDFILSDIDSIMGELGFRGDYKIVAVDNYHETQASVHWENGNFKLNIEKIKQDVLDLVLEAKGQLIGEKND